MEVFRILGGRTLNGEVRVNGAKNAALPILAATLLTAETCVLRNVPDLSDVRFMLEILRHHGAIVETPAPGVVRVTAASVHPHTPYELVRKMRASICLLGPLVGRLKMADIAQPGGCVIGTRPIDLHLKGLSRLGCVITHHSGYITVDATNARGGRVFLGGPNGGTVTGTANLVMAAVLTPGVTIIDYAACEPEVVDLCRMLSGMGASIENIGGPTLRITGVESLRGADHTVVSDRIEAGTYAIAAAMAGGEVTVRGARADHLGAFLDKFEEAGVDFDILDADTLRVRGSAGRLKPVDIVTLPHPGFPTDLQAQFTAMLTQADGASTITERIYPNRFMHVPELSRMGTNISVDGACAVIRGATALTGAPVMASDLRASAALILAGLVAGGETWVQRIYHLDRGYEQFDKRLAALGASVERLAQSSMPGDLRDE
jgi:UDP-N-acetylglucosamine 1-carboxyvinyltransferase